MPGDLTVRLQTDDDAAEVAALLAHAFVVEPEVVGLEQALSQRSDSRGLVAVRGDAVVAHVRLTRGWIDAPERIVEVLVLSPLAVDPPHQRQGIGGWLLEAALRDAEAEGSVAVFLEGDPGYYARHGWRPATEIGVTPPSARIPAAACQVVTLAGYEPWMQGRLVYADAFWAQDCVGLRGEALRQARAALGA